MDQQPSEDVIIFLAFSPKTIDVTTMLDYLGNFFMRKNQIDPSDRFNVISFTKNGPIYFEDFSRYGERMFEQIKEIVPQIENVDMAGGLSIALNMILEVFKLIGGKVFRIIILTDKSTPPLEITEYLRDLTYQVAGFPCAIDIIRIDTYDRHEDKKLLRYINPTGGSMFYYENEEDAGNILFDLAEKKDFKTSVYSNRGELTVNDDNRGLIDLLSEEPVKLPASTDEFETITCNICRKPKNLYECPQCGVTYHIECLANWSLYSNLGKRLKNIFRCPSCFRLLRIDLKYVRALTERPEDKKIDDETETFLYNQSVLEEYNREELLRSIDPEEPELIIDGDKEDKFTIDIPEIVKKTKIHEKSEAQHDDFEIEDINLDEIDSIMDKDIQQYSDINENHELSDDNEPAPFDESNKKEKGFDDELTDEDWSEVFSDSDEDDEEELFWCPNCGQVLPPKYKFCTNCGKKLVDE